MKRTLFIIALAFASVSQVFAATAGISATPSPTTPQTNATGAANIKQIEDLKDRIATTVAQLSQTQKKAISGTIKTVSVSTITIGTDTSDIKIELTDSIKVFQTTSGKRETLTTDDLSKGDWVVVFGDYDATLDLLKAKVIVIQAPLPDRIAGTITDVDKKNFTLTVQTTDNQSYLVDIEKNTSILAYDATKGIGKGGFSKVQIGETAHVIGTDEPKKDHTISALRVLDIGFVFGAPTPTPTPTIEAATTATPSATAKPTPKVTMKASPTPTQ